MTHPRKPASPQPAQPRDVCAMARRGALFLAALYLTHLAFAVPEMVREAAAYGETR